MTVLLSILRSFAGILFGVAFVVTSASAQTRGELLYSTHCDACHTAQIHWRARRAVTDWYSLTAEVRKWQVAASLAWSEDDVVDVARYLNASIYHFVDTPAAARTSATGPELLLPSRPAPLIGLSVTPLNPTSVLAR